MEIVLVRHGATDWNLQGRCQGSSDRELSEAGIRQAEQIADLLGSGRISARFIPAISAARAKPPSSSAGRTICRC